MELGKVGVWCGQFRTNNGEGAREAARFIETCGYKTLWIPGGRGGDIFGHVNRVLDATDELRVITGVLNIWMHPSEDIASGYSATLRNFPNRFQLGLGVSHEISVSAFSHLKYVKPYSKMVETLNELDGVSNLVPKRDRFLAALGPRMLALARDRAAGAHTYLTTTEHTAFARTILGAAPVLAPELMVVLDANPSRARDTARGALLQYLDLPNYTNNLNREGFSERDFHGGGSNRLVDQLVGWGGVDDIASRIREHLSAGADHVCLQVLTSDLRTFPLSQLKELASFANEC